MTKNTIYQLNQEDANKYFDFDDEQNELYFKYSDKTFLKLNSIKKRKLKSGTKIKYEWWTQILPEAWTKAFEHDVDEANQELYESLFSTYDDIEESARLEAYFIFSMIAEEMGLKE